MASFSQTAHQPKIAREKAIYLALGLLLWLLPPHPAISYTAFALAILLGIPHGALDHKIFLWIKGKSYGSPIPFLFYVYYLCVMALAVAEWLFAPVLALLAFLVFSAYHFGEAQLIYLKDTRPVRHLLYMLWGTLILLGILLPNLAEVQQILAMVELPDMAFQSLEAYSYYIIGGLLFAWLAVYLTTGPGTKLLLLELAETLLILAIAWRHDVLAAFAFFFGLWHAGKSVGQQIEKFRFQDEGYSLWQYARESLPFFALSIFGMLAVGAVCYYWLDFGEKDLLLLLFVLISVITFPHVMLMSRLLQKHQPPLVK